jgi:hypothetical protein
MIKAKRVNAYSFFILKVSFLRIHILYFFILFLVNDSFFHSINLLHNNILSINQNYLLTNAIASSAGAL